MYLEDAKPAARRRFSALRLIAHEQWRVADRDPPRTDRTLARVLIAHARAISGGPLPAAFVFDGIELTILAARQMPSSFAGPVLVVWANAQMAAKAEYLDPTAICATSWERDGLKDWVRVWGATDPRTGEHYPAEVPPRAVAGAVASISFHMPGDVLHPSDKARAVDTLRALKLYGHDIDPPVVRALAIRRGWLPQAADRLAEIAEKFTAGKAVKGGTKMNVTRAREMVARFEHVDI
jgi:hypothetical protein